MRTRFNYVNPCLTSLDPILLFCEIYVLIAGNTIKVYQGCSTSKARHFIRRAYRQIDWHIALVVHQDVAKINNIL